MEVGWWWQKSFSESPKVKWADIEEACGSRMALSQELSP